MMVYDVYGHQHEIQERSCGQREWPPAGSGRRISRYSFGIYLLHWFFIELTWRLAGHFLKHQPYPATILTLGVVSVVCSIGTTRLLSTLKIGPYLVGKLGVDYRDRSQQALTKAPALAS